MDEQALHQLKSGKTLLIRILIKLQRDYTETEANLRFSVYGQILTSSPSSLQQEEAVSGISQRKIGEETMEPVACIA